jgi:hypothetical protein
VSNLTTMNVCMCMIYACKYVRTYECMYVRMSAHMYVRKWVNIFITTRRST